MLQSLVGRRSTPAWSSTLWSSHQRWRRMTTLKWRELWWAEAGHYWSLLSGMFDTVNWETLWHVVSRSTAGVLAVTKRGWFTTPDRCALQMKDRQSSSPAYTAGRGHRHVLRRYTTQLYTTCSFFQLYCADAHHVFVPGIRRRRTLDHTLDFFFLLYVVYHKQPLFVLINVTGENFTKSLCLSLLTVTRVWHV